MIIQPIKYDPKPQAHIFGVYWAGTQSSSMLRTDDSALFAEPNPAVNNGNGSSPFDEYMPWAGMERVEDANAGTLVKIPKFWYKWTRNSEVTGDMKLQIANHEVDGFYVSPAHADRGDGKGERDLVYVGAYESANNTYKSTSGVLPKVSITRATARTNIHNLGSTIWQFDFAMYWTICMLYLVEFADWNSQNKIGYGLGGQGTLQQTGITDSFLYHTGTVGISRSEFGHAKYRNIENLWGNVYFWCDGIYFNGANYTNAYYIKNPLYFSDNSNGVFVGTVPSLTSGYIQKWIEPNGSNYNWVLLPASVQEQKDIYVCDEYYKTYNYKTGPLIRVGGNFEITSTFGNPTMYGLFSLDTTSLINETAANIGCRLMKLP